MNTTKILCTLALVSASIGCATASNHPAAKDAKKVNQAAAKQQAAAPAMDEAAIMQAYMASMTPGPQHKELAATAGRWTTHMISTWDPSAPPQQSTGSASFEMTLDGRYLIERATGTTPMGPFEGMGITAYNNVTNKYQHMWIDNMGTGLMVSEGTTDASGAVNFMGSYDDPLRGQVKVRGKHRKLAENHLVYEMWELGDAGERKLMEITYKRG
ncbi:MAG: DUF1579 domain-containing protein [Planctomycetota bacterium]